MTVPAWASDFVTSFYAKVADVNAPSNYAAQFVPDGDLYLRGDFKGHEQIEQAQKGFWTRVKASKHHSLKVFYNEQYPDTIFVNGLVDLDQNDGNNLKDVEFVSRFVLDSDKKIKKYRVWTFKGSASTPTAGAAETERCPIAEHGGGEQREMLTGQKKKADRDR